MTSREVPEEPPVPALTVDPIAILTEAVFLRETAGAPGGTRTSAAPACTGNIRGCFAMARGATSRRRKSG